MIKHLVIRVEGRVQGVFYRQSTYEEASRLGLAGTVENLPDGSVEIHAEGDEAKLDELLNWCKEGPSHAKVKKIEVSEQSSQEFADFKII